MKRAKKTLALMMVLALSMSLFGCKNEEQTSQEPEQGGFNEVEIAEDDNKENDPNAYVPFTEQSDDLTYEYKTIKSPYMALEFNVPKNWEATFVSARTIKFETPENDAHLPGYTAYLDCTMYTKGDEIVIPSMFEEMFEQDRYALTYNIDGTRYYEAYNETPDKTYTTTDIADNTENFSFLEYNNVFAENSTGISARGYSLTSFHFNVDWSEYHNIDMSIEALTLRTLVKEEDKETARTILTHIVSTFKGYEAPVPSSRSFTLGGLNIALPEDFENLSEKIAYVPDTKNSPYAGMYVGVFSEDLKLNEFNPLAYAMGPAGKFATAFMPSSAFNSMCNMPNDAPMTIDMNGKTAKFISSDITYIAGNSVKEGNFYGKSGIAMLFVYDISANNENKQIALWFTLQQVNEAMDVNDLIIAKTNF